MQRLTREQSRELTQKKLREAALKEFAYTGFAGASIDRISENAGFSRGAFYANYKSKHGLLLELMREQTERDLTEWHALLRDTPPDQLFEIIADHITQLMQESPWGLFSVEALLQARRDAAFAEQLRSYRAQLHVSLGELNATLFRHAGKQLPTDSEQLGRAFYSLAIGLFLNLDRDDPKADSSAAGRTLALFMQSLLDSAPDIEKH